MNPVGTITQEEIFLEMKRTEGGKAVPFSLLYQKCNRTKQTGGDWSKFDNWIWAKMMQNPPKIVVGSQNRKAEKTIRWRTTPITLYHPETDQFKDIYPALILVFNNRKVID